MSAFGTFLVGLAGPVVRRALTSIGVGVVSYAAIATALNAAIDSAKAAFSGFTGDALSILSLSGVPESMSIIAGAMIARVAVMSLSKLELLK